MPDKQSYEEKKQEKEAKKEAQRKEQARKKWKNIGFWSAIIGIPVIAVGVLIFLGVQSNQPSKLAGEQHPAPSRTHIDPNTQPSDWTTSPPTGGEHAPSPLGAGFYDSPQNLRNVVHSLEHGAIALYYKEEALSEEDINRVQDLTENKYGGDKFLALPYNEMDSTYAITAWEFLDKFDEWDEERIDQFVEDHMGKGPEPNAPLGS